MYIAQRGIVERHAREELGVGHVLPRHQVTAVGNRLAQVGTDQTDGLQRAGIGDRRGGGGHIGLDGVGQGIHARGREAGHLAGGARRGVDRDQRQLRLARAVNALIVADMPAVGGAQRDALGAVRKPAYPMNNRYAGFSVSSQYWYPISSSARGSPASSSSGTSSPANTRACAAPWLR
ncbi:hypothetical protein WR25_06561 [Diploscapter pachys]|uniref:Uncharacterized protein n=1 Tax=Diploscapter pachys TaxID=2018661 RepID=A0A2A2KB01_9BILA|nr:hypothetical protein WR25_06561 [Diploscapter pachys]